MNKKLLIIGFMAVFMMVAVSFAAAINTENMEKEKESPLYKLRARKAVQEKKEILKDKAYDFVGRLMENRIYTPYNRNRILFNQNDGEPLMSVSSIPTNCYFCTQKCNINQNNIFSDEDDPQPLMSVSSVPTNCHCCTLYCKGWIISAMLNC